MKDACYMLTVALDSFERQILKNAWNKLWPELKGEKTSMTTTGRRLPTLSNRSQYFREDVDVEDVDVDLETIMKM
ncbi:hypothetical protein TNCV_342991 [Trichonephila clavipes]|nr:hypothetical protein TNCV_342991 [Trichonephila clavipes]